MNAYANMQIAIKALQLSLGLIWTHHIAYEWQWTLTAAVLIALGWLPWYLHYRLMTSLRGISNAILSLKDGDFSICLVDGLS